MDKCQILGCATKYLQNYFNWFYLCEKFKHETLSVAKILLMS